MPKTNNYMTEQELVWLRDYIQKRERVPYTLVRELLEAYELKRDRVNELEAKLEEAGG